MLINFLAFVSIIAAVFVTMVAVGVQNNVSSFKATAQTSLVNAFTSVSNIVFAYGESTAKGKSTMSLTEYSQS